MRVGAEPSLNHTGEILDYSKVTVKRVFCNSPNVPDIAHHQAVCAEILRLLREERKKRGLSNYVIAKRTGVSQSMISLVERGLRNPTLELVLRLADGIRADLPSIIKKAQSAVSKNDLSLSSRPTARPGKTDR